jgi:hypothetical protein
MVVRTYALAASKTSFFTRDQSEILFILSVVSGRGGDRDDDRAIANRAVCPYIPAVRDFACLVAARKGLLP